MRVFCFFAFLSVGGARKFRTQIHDDVDSFPPIYYCSMPKVTYCKEIARRVWLLRLANVSGRLLLQEAGYCLVAGAIRSHRQPDTPEQASKEEVVVVVQIVQTPKDSHFGVAFFSPRYSDYSHITYRCSN